MQVSMAAKLRFYHHQKPLKKRDLCPKCKKVIVPIRELAEHGFMCKRCEKQSA